MVNSFQAKNVKKSTTLTLAPYQKLKLNFRGDSNYENGKKLSNAKGAIFLKKINTSFIVCLFLGKYC